MTSTELESLVVRLVGDGSSYQKMLKEAEQSSKDTAAKVDGLSKQIEGYQKGLEGFAKGALNALSVVGVSASFWGAFQKFEDSQKVMLRLKAAVEANGQAVAPVVASYEQFAKEMFKLTGTGKDATLALLQQAESHGISGEAAKRAARNAIALAAAKGGEAESYIRVTAALEEGHTEMLNRMLPALKEFKDESEKATKAQQLLGNMFGVAQASMGTVSSRIEMLQKNMGRLVKEVGALVSTALAPLVDYLTRAVDWFNTLDPTIRMIVVGFVSLVVAIQPLIIVYGYLSSAITKIGTAAIATAGFVSRFMAVLVTNPAMLMIAAVTALAASLLYLVWNLSASSAGLAKWNAILRESDDMTAAQIKTVRAHAKAELEAANALETRTEKQAYLNKALQAAQNNLIGLKAVVRSAEEEFARLARWENLGIVGGVDYEAAQKRVKETNALLAEGQQRIEDLSKAISALDPKKRLQELAKEVAEFVQELDHQSQIMGMSAEQAKLFDYYLSGLGVAELDAAEAAVKFNETLKEQSGLQDKADELVKSLMDEAATLGMGSKEAEAFKLRLHGLSAETADYVEMLAKEHDIFLKARSITEEFRTPLEKLESTYKDLTAAVERGMITRETYTRAAEKAEKDYADALNATRDAITGLDATLSGSVQNRVRVAAYLDRLQSTAPSAVRPAPNLAGGQLFDPADFRRPAAGQEQPANPKFNFGFGGGTSFAGMITVASAEGARDAVKQVELLGVIAGLIRVLIDNTPKFGGANLGGP